MTRDFDSAGEMDPGPRVRSHPLRTVPKADLHCHLDGSLRPSTVVALAAERGHALGALEPAEARVRLRAPAASSLPAYLGVFEITLGLMQTRSALRRVARELAEDAAAEHVDLLEVRFCPFLHEREGLKPAEALDAVLEGLAEGPVSAGVLLCAIRDRIEEEAMTLVDLAVARRASGVVGVDLAGPEHGYPASRFRTAFRRAADAGLGVTIHAGEAAGPGSVWSALDDCRAARIGHGCRSVDDAELVESLRQRRTVLEVCPTSNRQTGAVAAEAPHPALALAEAGVRVSVATDNRLVSDTRVELELERLGREGRLDGARLAAFVRAGFEGSFHPAAAQRLEAAESALATLAEWSGYAD